MYRWSVRANEIVAKGPVQKDMKKVKKAINRWPTRNERKARAAFLTAFAAAFVASFAATLIGVAATAKPRVKTQGEQAVEMVEFVRNLEPEKAQQFRDFLSTNAVEAAKWRAVEAAAEAEMLARNK